MTASTTHLFSATELVRFRSCDQAGIVFYPRYFEMLNDLVEDWFAEVLGLPFQDMHREPHCMGVPTVQLTCSFVKPSYMGETLCKQLQVVKLGRASCVIGVVFHRNDAAEDVRLCAEVTLVCMDLPKKASMPWPDAIRECMSQARD